VLGRQQEFEVLKRTEHGPDLEASAPPRATGGVAGFRGIAVAAAIVIALQSTAAAAGTMSMTVSGIASPIEIQAFNFGASKGYDFTTGVAQPVSLGEVALTAPESAATPQLWVMAAGGTAITSVVLTVVSPVTAKTISDWTFTDARVTLAQAIAVTNVTTGAAFSLAYGTVTYRVYAADGTIAQQTCWNVTAGAAC
jgi:hypothetical protein